MTRIREIRTTPVLAPIARPLRSASGFIERVPLVIIDVLTDDGVSGTAYAQVYFPELLPALDRTIAGMAGMLAGLPLVPRDLHAFLRRRCRLFGLKNLMGAALGGLDMALWDAWARARSEPLATAIGASPRAHRTYHSVGMYDANTVAEIVDETLEQGFAGLKIKAGFPDFADDLAVVRAARRLLGSGPALMIDYNQSLDGVEALRRCHALDDEGLEWIEEPVAADDFEGCARIAAAVKTPIQIGENFQGPEEMRLAIRDGAMDLAMPDAQLIHGVTGFLEAGALAATAGIPLSSHMFVEASAHLLCGVRTAHWLEFMDVAGHLQRQPVMVEQGRVAPRGPGIGLDWDRDRVERHRLALP